MYKSVLLLVISALFGTATAQKRISAVHVFKNGNHLSAEPIDLTDAETIDTSLLVVGYSYEYQKEKWNKYGWGDTPMTLQIGASFTKFTLDVLTSIDRAYTPSAGKIPLGATYPRLWTTYYDRREERIVTEHRMPFTNKYLIRYEEPAFRTQWTLSDETLTILGYKCRKATAQFRGRTWTVWFAPDIPVSVYVWNLGNLPGLILKADSDMFRFRCVSITRSAEPILRPACKIKKMTRKQWRKLEQNYHETPYPFFSDGGACLFYDERGELTADNWTIEYNPIELE